MLVMTSPESSTRGGTGSHHRNRKSLSILVAEKGHEKHMNDALGPSNEATLLECDADEVDDITPRAPDGKFPDLGTSSLGASGSASETMSHQDEEELEMRPVAHGYGPLGLTHNDISTYDLLLALANQSNYQHAEAIRGYEMEETDTMPETPSKSDEDPLQPARDSTSSFSESTDSSFVDHEVRELEERLKTLAPAEEEMLEDEKYSEYQVCDFHDLALPRVVLETLDMCCV